ncbi:hypothetical protein ID866_6035 [Astraeus odoratus]|nr:hypothetical protein ID866_6035 [Astraeus odoratus]
MAAPITITADEVNCLIHAYFQDSGFQHSAFTLRTEGRLDHSDHIKKHIPRGELIELLSKALLYTEVEAHWKGDGLAMGCKNGFSLLEHHVCSLSPGELPEHSAQLNGEPTSLSAVGDAGSKRKSITPSTEDGRVEKRARREVDDKESAMAVDSASHHHEVGSLLRELSRAGTPKITPKEVKSPTEVQPAILENAVKKPRTKRITSMADSSKSDDVCILRAHKSEVFVASWNPVTPGSLITGSRDATVIYWDIPTDPQETLSSSSLLPTIKLSLTNSDQADLTSLDWNQDGSLVAIGSYDAVLRICHASGSTYLIDRHHKVQGHHSDYLQSLTCGGDRVVHIVSLSGTKPIGSLRGHTGELTMIKCNPSRTHLASCSDDATARIWNLKCMLLDKTPPAPVILQGHTRCLTSVKWCPRTNSETHELVATASFDMTARLWDSVTGDCLKVFADHTKHVYSLSFSPDGCQLITGGGDGYLYMYDSKCRSIFVFTIRRVAWLVTGPTMLVVGLSNAFRPAVSRNLCRIVARPRVAAFSTSPNSGLGTLRSLPQKCTVLSAPTLLSRLVTTDAQAVTSASSQEAWKRFGITAAAVAGTIILAEGFLNRDKRDALSPAERSYLHDSFKYTGAGLILTALTARGMFRSGATYRIMATNPWVVLGVSLVGSIGTMMGVYYTPPEKTVQKHLFWVAFNACQGATLSPLFFFSPAILSRAALYTCGVVGSLSYIGATAKTEKYLYMGGPLLAGVTVVALSSLAPMALPLGLRGLAIAEALSLYGGLAVFGGFVLYDTQKILQHGRAAQAGLIPRDPVREAISLELDMLNIFIRMVQILAVRDNRK